MLDLAGIALRAVSVGGFETCIEIPGWGIALDIGRCPRSAVHRGTVLFTHAHMDHMGGVAFHAATRGLYNLEPPTYLVPRENVEALKGFFTAARRLDRSRLAHNTVPIGPGEDYQLKKGLIARPFRCVHVVPCQGYGIWESRMKLKPEYIGVAGAELKRMRESGVEITSTQEFPLLAFTGDSMIEVVEREEVVRKARVLIMESTFVDDRVSVEQCRERGHIHLYEIAERAELFENQAILLTHFSARYSKAEIHDALDKTLPPELRSRVTPLI